MEFISHPMIILMVGILSIPIYVTLGKLFFGESFESLGETIKYFFQPDWYSLLKGKFWEDWDATMKLNLYLACCFGWVAAISELIVRHVL